MITIQDLTTETAKMFEELVRDAGNWAGCPMLQDSKEVARKRRGNLADMKKKGLITTAFDSEIGATFVYFTDAGKELAKQAFGIEIHEG